jgi:acyl dehydratase
MKIDVIQEHRFEPHRQQYTRKDSIIYALGLGYGSDPLSTAHLQFLYEEALQAVPSMCVVLGHPGMWSRDPRFGVDWVKLLHAEQSFELHRPLAAEGDVVARHSFIGVEDKGAGKGAMLYQQKKLHDAATDELIATVRTTLMLRGDGGSGSFGEAVPAPGALPETAPHRVIDIPTLPQAALIYRLSGDYNPIHASPDIARKAGFDKPILHGLCSMGVACRALIQAYAEAEPSRLKSMFVRFSKPVYPGETLRLECYEIDGQIRFRARAVERDLVVLDRGAAVFA